MHDRFYDDLEEEEEDYFELPPSPSLGAARKKQEADIAALKLGPGVAAEEGIMELPLSGAWDWRKDGPFRVEQTQTPVAQEA